MIEISKTRFLELYEEGLLYEVVSIGTKVYARTAEGQAHADKPFKTVWCTV